MYKPEFTKCKRDGKMSLWVKMPNGEEWNIWDMADTNPWVESAIISAFERGFHAYKMASAVDISIGALEGFKETKCST